MNIQKQNTTLLSKKKSKKQIKGKSRKKRKENMCFMGYIQFYCNNCGERLHATTLRKRDCRRCSCDKKAKGSIKVDRKLISSRITHVTFP